MKRLYAAAALLLFIAGAYLYGYFYTSRVCKQASILLEDCIMAYDSEDSSEASARKLKKFWDKKEQPLSIFANHQRIDDIEQAISSLVIYSGMDEEEIFYEYSETVKTLIHQLMEDTKPSIHSVF